MRFCIYPIREPAYDHYRLPAQTCYQVSYHLLTVIRAGAATHHREPLERRIIRHRSARPELLGLVVDLVEQRWVRIEKTQVVHG